METQSREYLLPQDGIVNLEDIANAIGSAPRVLGVPDTLEIRTVLLVQPRGQVSHFATRMLVGGGNDLPEDQAVTTDLGQAQLWAWRFSATDVEDRSDLEELLAFWKTVSPGQVNVDFQIGTNINRERSLNRWMPTPCWWLNVYDKVPPAGGDPPPRGPFFAPKARFYAPTLGDMAVAWLGDDLHNEVPTWRRTRIPSSSPTPAPTSRPIECGRIHPLGRHPRRGSRAYRARGPGEDRRVRHSFLVRLFRRR